MTKISSNKILEKCEVIDIADKGKSVAKSKSGEIVFLENAVPGDIVDVLIKRKRKGSFTGKILKFNLKSQKRVKPICEHFGVCGGCKWQNMNYNSQLFYKEKRVHENLFRIGKIKPKTVFQFSQVNKYIIIETRWSTLFLIHDGYLNPK